MHRKALSIASLSLLALPGLALQSFDHEEEAKLVGSGADYLDGLGYALSVSGSTAVVGCTELSFPDFTPGSAYVFVRDAFGQWSEEARLVPSNGVSHPPTSFGWGTAIDGDRVVVGGPQHDVTGTTYVFERAGTIWTETQVLLPSDMAFGGRFGEEVAVLGDRLVVGGPGKAPNGPGSVYIFELGPGGWAEVVRLEAPGTDDDDRYGSAIALGVDRLAVGAWMYDGLGPDHGAIFLYEFDGVSWSLAERLDVPGATGLGGGLVMDGDRLMARASDGVHVFERVGGSWLEVQLLSDASGGTGIGGSMDLDGERAVMGADSHGGAGRAYVFERIGGTWQEVLALAGSEANTGDGFGSAVGIDGPHIVVGTPVGDAPLSNFAGVAYAFRYSPALALPLVCAGDGSGAACPCGNKGASGAGCANSSGQGGTLEAFGTASVTADDLVVRAGGVPTSQPALLFVGDSSFAVPFGDGLRCVGGAVQRLGVGAAGASGSATWGTGLGSLAGWSAGSPVFLQVWYRDPAGGPCGGGFNLTAALELVPAP